MPRVHDKEDLDNICRLVQEYFELPDRPKVLGGGFWSVVLSFKDGLAIKLIRGSSFGDGLDQWEFEYKALEELSTVSEVSDLIPRLIKAEQTEGSHPLKRLGVNAWIIMSLLPGKPLPKLKTDEILSDHPGIVDEIASFLFKLHRAPVVNMKYLSNKPLRDVFDSLEKMRECAAGNSKDLELIDVLTDHAKEFYIASDKKVLTHGDVNMGNIMVNEGRLSGVIDFASTSRGVLEYDWSHAPLTSGFTESLLSSYRKIGGVADRLKIYFGGAVRMISIALMEERMGDALASLERRKVARTCLAEIGLEDSIKVL